MARHRLLTLTAALGLVALASPGGTQEKPEASKAPEAPSPKADRPADRPEGATLRVQVVITRFEGEKKIASLPYAFTVTSEGRPARMRMGVDTPIPVGTQLVAGAGDAKPPTSYQYRNVGTNLDCSANATKDGRYQLHLNVENSSAISGASSSGREGMPMFRRFDASLDPILRDGQSMQTVASTDPVTGEVVKIDVTMNVVK